MQKIQGGCLCGAVRYRSDAVPLLTAICKCKNCQRQTGTAFSILVAVPKGALIMEGAQPETYQDVGDGGLLVLRKFCSKCGSPIFTEAAATPTIDWLKAGTLDDISWLQPCFCHCGTTKSLRFGSGVFIGDISNNA